MIMIMIMIILRLLTDKDNVQNSMKRSDNSHKVLIPGHNDIGNNVSVKVQHLEMVNQPITKRFKQQ